MLQTQAPRGPDCPLQHLHAWPGVGREPGRAESLEITKIAKQNRKRLWFILFDMLWLILISRLALVVGDTTRRGIRSGLWAYGPIWFDQPNAAWLPSAGLHSPLQQHQSPSPIPQNEYCGQQISGIGWGFLMEPAKRLEMPPTGRNLHTI